jgi:hypothetical protein
MPYLIHAHEGLHALEYTDPSAGIRAALLCDRCIAFSPQVVTKGCSVNKEALGFVLEPRLGPRTVNTRLSCFLGRVDTKHLRVVPRLFVDQELTIVAEVFSRGAVEPLCVMDVPHHVYVHKHSVSAASIHALGGPQGDLVTGQFVTAVE